MHIWWSYVTKCTSLKFPKFHLYMHVSIVELACDNQFLKLSDECDRSYWTKYHYKLSNHINHIFWHHSFIRHCESHRNDMGHMPMIYSKIKGRSSAFFNSDQISDMCNFGVSIGIFPLIRIVWIKECLFWRFEEKSVHIWWSYVTKCTSLKFPKFHLYMHVSIVELACDNQFSKLSDEHDRSYWTKCHYKLSNHINHIFWHHGCIGHHESDRNDRSHAYVYWKIKRDLLLFDSVPNFRCV